MVVSSPIKWGARAFLAVGYGALAASLYFLVAHTVFWMRADSTEGTVMGWEYMEQSRATAMRPYAGTRAKATVVAFEGPSGEEIVFATDWGSEFGIYDVGETITVLYDADDAVGSARIRGFVSLYLGPLMLLVFGGGFWFCGTLAGFFAEEPEARRRRS